jgi:hypothetical protein
LCRWTAPDPTGTKGGLNLYSYVTNNPVILHDPNGTDGEVCGVYDEQQLVCRSEPCVPANITPEVPAPAPSSPTAPRPRIRVQPSKQAASSPPPPDKSESEWVKPGELLIPVGGNIAEYGNVADFMRAAYKEGAGKIFSEAQQMLKAGKSEEDVARWVVGQRNTLKQVLREQGPKLFQAVAELRNKIKYGNKLGPEYEALKAANVESIMAKETLSEAEKIAEIAKVDEKIIGGVAKTSGEFNAAGSRLRFLGKAGAVAGFVLTAMTDSPESLSPLPVSQEKEVATEKSRLHFGIPPDVIIDVHGHRKKASYEQVDIFDPHVGGEIDQETEEALWFLGVPITYHAYIPGGGGKQMTWTVPGR